MALPAAMAMEIRPDVGLDTNGGAFKAGGVGTDYSQQNSKNTVGVNISTADGLADGSANFVSATANFTGALVDNIIYAAGGDGTIAPAHYHVLSVTDATTIVLDRAIAASVGMDLNIGGALATLNAAIDMAVAGDSTTHTGNVAWIKKTGTLVYTAAKGCGLQSNGWPFVIKGYDVTRGDDVSVSITTATNSINLFTSGGDAYNWQWYNIDFSTTAATPGDCFHALNSNWWFLGFYNCTFDGFHQAMNGNFGVDWTFPNLTLERCVFKNSTDHAVFSTAPMSVFACKFLDNSGDGIHMARGNKGQIVMRSCVFARNGCGVRWGEAHTSVGTDTIQPDISNCAFFDNVGDGFLIIWLGGDGITSLTLVNSIFFGNGGFGINLPDVRTIPGNWLERNCAFGDNALGDRNNFPVGTGDIVITTDPFTDSALGDYTLNNVVTGGRLCRGTGTPTALPPD
jgi:hypothetical protein